ncbi:hypothetical protein Tco_0352552 [Tanacetum coccineum]
MNCEHPLPVRFQNSQVVVLYHFITSSTTTWNILRGGVSSRKYSTSVTKTKAADYGHKSKWKEDLVPNSCSGRIFIKTYNTVTKDLEIFEWLNKSNLIGLQYERDDDALYNFKKATYTELKDPRH